MILINRTEVPRFNRLTEKTVMPGRQTNDGRVQAVLSDCLEGILRQCGNSFLLRLNDRERFLVNRLLELDARGREFRTSDLPRESVEDPLGVKTEEKRRDDEIASADSAAAKAAKEGEEYERRINSEDTYSAKNGVSDANRKADAMEGNVSAERLDDPDADGVSLGQLAANNKFIQEHGSAAPYRRDTDAADKTDKTDKPSEPAEPAKPDEPSKADTDRKPKPKKSRKAKPAQTCDGFGEKASENAGATDL